MNKILDVVEDIKQNITDEQYKTIIKTLNEINKFKIIRLLCASQEHKFVCLFNWLDTNLIITEFKVRVLRKLFWRNV